MLVRSEALPLVPEELWEKNSATCTKRGMKSATISGGEEVIQALDIRCTRIQSPGQKLVAWAFSSLRLRTLFVAVCLQFRFGDMWYIYVVHACD